MFDETFSQALMQSVVSQRSRLGFSIAVNSLAPGQSLVNVAMDSWHARPWVVTLLKQRFSSGALVAPNATHGDPDSQLAVEAKVKLEWGVDGGCEVAIVDYPKSGSTFQVQAAYVRVYLDSVFAPGAFAPGVIGNNPTVGAWLSPGNRSSLDTPSMCPTFTQRVTVAAGSTSNIVSRPSRAIAYRITALAVEPPNTNITVFQFSAATLNANDYNAEPLSLPDNAGTERMYPYRAALVPLLPSTSGISISNNGPSGSEVFTVQWLLDLG